MHLDDIKNFLEADGSFERFVWVCARAYQHEDKLTTPFLKDQLNFHYLALIKSYRREVSTLEELNTEQINEAFMKEKEKDKQENQEAKDLKKNHRKTCAHLLDDLKLWVVPNKEYENFYRFMIELLTLFLKYRYKEDENLNNETAEIWQKNKLDDLKKKIHFYQNKHEEEMKRYKWLYYLNESIPCPFH